MRLSPATSVTCDGVMIDPPFPVRLTGDRSGFVVNVNSVFWNKSTYYPVWFLGLPDCHLSHASQSLGRHSRTGWEAQLPFHPELSVHFRQSKSRLPCCSTPHKSIVSFVHDVNSPMKMVKNKKNTKFCCLIVN